LTGSSQFLRFEAYVRFEFAKDYLASADYADIKKTISAVLKTADEVTAGKTIEMGQTIEQVERILGKPENIVKLGDKTIYTYKNLKVVFLNGKVADVQ
jgi:hypothetical protein